jgi:hypothetical protein
MPITDHRVIGFLLLQTSKRKKGKCSGREESTHSPKKVAENYLGEIIYKNHLVRLIPLFETKPFQSIIGDSDKIKI